LKIPTPFVWDDRLPDEDRALVDRLNSALRKLDGMRAVEIAVAGPFARSKVAWKLATYQHGLLHRIVELIDGVALGWNGKNILAAILSARAFMEAFAVLAELEVCSAQLLAMEDLAGLDRIAQNGLFSSRDPEWVEERPETKAINVLTFIDKFDKRADGLRHHYDLLSEICHPNAAGHARLFSELDRSDGTVRYSDGGDAGHAHLIMASIMPLLGVEAMMARLETTIIDIAGWHHEFCGHNT
jgi:hypothetical protein